MRVRLGLIQMTCGLEKEDNVRRAIRLTHEAADGGAQLVCHQELFNTIYFCHTREGRFSALAEPIPGPTTFALGRVALERRITVICPIFERGGSGNPYNSAAVLGPDGSLVGVYRKMSIPIAHDSDEKFYFSPGDIGYRIFDIPGLPRFGILICYDRHFPEAARVLALEGALMIFVPASTPMKSRHLWEIELRGMAVANLCFVAGVNRVGYDVGGSSQRLYYGSSLLISPRGEIIAQAPNDRQTVLVCEADLTEVNRERAFWRFLDEIRTDSVEILTDKSQWRI